LFDWSIATIIGNAMPPRDPNDDDDADDDDADDADAEDEDDEADDDFEPAVSSGSILLKKSPSRDFFERNKAKSRGYYYSGGSSVF
jgi:hypothetical protein